MANQTLVIFSTDYIYPDDGRSADLFSKSRISAGTIPSKRLDSFFERHSDERNSGEVYQISEKSVRQLVFGTKMLQNPQPKKAGQYLFALVADVIDFIKSGQAGHSLDEILHIKLIAHRKEFSAYKDQSFQIGIKAGGEMKLKTELAALLEKELVWCTDKIKQEDSSDEVIQLELIGFGHEPGHFVFRLLKDFQLPKRYEDSDFSQYIKWVIDLEKTEPDEILWTKDCTKLDIAKIWPIANRFKFYFFKYHEDSIKLFNPEKDRSKHFRSITEQLKNEEKADGFPVAILFASIRHLKDFSFYYRVTYFFHGEETSKDLRPFKDHTIPLITMSIANIMFGKEKAMQSLYPSGKYELKKEILEGFVEDIDNRYRFLDSSIWYRYVAFTTREIFNDQLHQVLSSLTWAYNRNLYCKRVTREYLEFCNRQLRNAYIDGKFGLGHASLITPYNFHSEFFMENRAKKLYEELTIRKTGNKLQPSKTKNLSWNFILVDDYANLQLSNISYADEILENTVELNSTKAQIIEELIDYSPEEIPDIGYGRPHRIINDELVSQTSLESAVNKIKDDFQSESTPKVYDIILLDYLFSRTETGVPKYGIEFLRRIYDEELRIGKSLLHSYWIYPISVFSEAMLSSFREQGIEHINEHWQLARGADPINTPHLFRSSLFEFLKVQYGKLYFNEIDLFEFLHNHPISDQDKRADIKNWAVVAFRQFIEQFSGIEGVPTGSSFGRSMRNYMQENEGAATSLMQNIRQLLYLLAYTTGFDAKPLQLEFNVIKSTFDEYKKGKGHNNEERIKLKEVEQQIENLGFAIYQTFSKYG